MAEQDWKSCYRFRDYMVKARLRLYFMAKPTYAANKAVRSAKWMYEVNFHMIFSKFKKKTENTDFVDNLNE